MPYISYLLDDKLSNNIASARPHFGAFDINKVAGKALWISADDETFTDVSGSIVALDGEKIFRWNDKSGLDNHMFMTVESKRPTFNTNDLNGLPTVSFVKEDSQYMIANNPSNFNIDTPSVFLVGRWNSGDSFCGKGDGNLSDGRHRKLQIRGFSGGTNFSWWTGTDAQSGCSANATMTNWNIFSIRAKWNTKTILNVNGVDTIQTYQVNNTALNEVAFTIGSAFSHGAEFGSVDIAELIILNRVATDRETSGIIDYLSAKWGISVTNTAPVSIPERVAVPPSIITGTYIGNNTADTEITVGFRPDLVIIKGEALEYAVFRTSAHNGDSTSYLANAVSNATGLIKSFTATGFTIGTTAGVNTQSVIYHYTAIRKGGGINLEVGYYTGNGVDDRSIGGLSFQPDFVYIKRNGASNGIFRDSLEVGDLSHQPTANSNAVDCIQALNSNGFQIGTNALVNTNTNRYEYFALKTNNFFKVGTYTGNGQNNRTITGVGFSSDLLIIKRDGANSLGFRDSSVVGDLTASFSNGNYGAGTITSVNNDGFVINNVSTVNTNALVYHYFALAKGSTRSV